MTTAQNDIVIVGAGPTGLMLSNLLIRFGIDHIIVDGKAGPTDQSRALVVHARSMEIYQQLGLSKEIVDNGQKNDGMTFYKNGKIATSVTIVNPDEQSSPFPYLMMYEQSKNEHLLYNNILNQNKTVQWNTTINEIKEQNGLYQLHGVQDGQEINYTCKYLIACDGSKSTVRDFSQVPFLGSSYTNVFYVADTLADGGFSSQKISIFLKKDGLNVLFPMTGANHFRVLGILPTEYYHREDLPFEDILEKVKEEMQLPVKFHDTNWHSTYRLHHKKVAHFSKGNIFFAGDAAHVHSPVGGQGMNTGLQDVYNLAWKLALTQTGKAGSELLNTYHEERNPVAEGLLKSTDKAFSVMATDNIFYNFFRLNILTGLVSLLTKSKAFRKFLFLNVSQIKVNYKASSLAKGVAGKVHAGERLPYFQIDKQGNPVSIYDMVNTQAAAPFTVLLYNIPVAGLELLNAAYFHILPLKVSPSNTEATKNAGLPQSFVIVVRPDNYIAYIADKPDAKALTRFMSTAYYLTY